MTLGKMCISASVIKIESSVWYHFIRRRRRMEGYLGFAPEKNTLRLRQDLSLEEVMDPKGNFIL